METGRFQRLNLGKIKTPCYLVDETLIEKNLKILQKVKGRTGCKILLALKGFSMFSTFPLIRKYLDGVCASSPNEARLGCEEFRKEVHVFAPAYSEDDIKELLKTSSTIVFNSFGQLEKYRKKVRGKVEIGLRVNPEYSEIKYPLYDPCAKGSRMGVLLEELEKHSLKGIDGLHFHALCEQNADVLQRVLERFEEKFGKYLNGMKWVNFGGGHHISREDYDVDMLCRVINDFKKKYKVKVYLEPGEAIALNTGVLIAKVLDIVHNEADIAILDTSAEAHMPDTLAMPYKAKIIGAAEPGTYRYNYRLAGATCLAGDVIGDYSFPKKLKAGDKLMFTDMAHYTMVKNTTFNGVRLPSIAILKKNGKVKVVKEFGYADFRNRLS